MRKVKNPSDCWDVNLFVEARKQLSNHLEADLQMLINFETHNL